MARPGYNCFVGRDFQTAAPGLYALGPMAMENFGPLLRFVCGSAFAAPRLARVLRRRVLLRRLEDWLRQGAKSLAQRLQSAFA
jgi:hypothetical protein